jgi:hypothetical protein
MLAPVLGGLWVFGAFTSPYKGLLWVCLEITSDG